MIFCANCGHQLQDDASYCLNCGIKNVQPPSPDPGTKNEIIHLQQEKEHTLAANSAIIEIVNSDLKQYCRNCGKEVPNGSVACMACGLPPMKAYNFCPACGFNCHQEAVLCIKCGINLESLSNSQPVSGTERRKEFCRNCGKEVTAGAYACLNCGLPPGKSKNFCPTCGSETHNDAVICIKCGAGLEQNYMGQIKAEIPVSNQENQQSATKPQPAQSNTVVVVGSQKSVGTALLLAFLFGPFGLLYATPVGGIIMIFLGVILGLLIPIIGFLLAWIICIIWAVVAVQNSNSASVSKAAGIINRNNNQ